MKGVFENLQEVSQEDEPPEGLMETAEDLVSATVMNHQVSPVCVTPFLPSTRVPSALRRTYPL